MDHRQFVVFSGKKEPIRKSKVRCYSSKDNRTKANFALKKLKLKMIKYFVFSKTRTQRKNNGWSVEKWSPATHIFLQ